MRSLRLVVAGFAVTAGLVPAIALTPFVLLPARSLRTLPLAVLAPEVSLALVVWHAVALAIALLTLRGRTRVAAGVTFAAAIAIDALPLGSLLGTIANAKASVSQTFGDDGALPETARRALDDRAFDPLRTLRVARTPGVRYEAAVNLGSRHGRGILVDVWRPSGSGVHPTVVSVYGGAWRFGSRTEAAWWNARLAARGYTIVAVDYRHVPFARWPAQRDDVADALDAIAANAARIGVDVDRLTLIGRSAGAQLALLAAYDRHAPFPIRGVVAFYPPTDLRAGYYDPPKPDPADVRAILRDYLGGTPETRPDAYRDASPLTSVRAGLPPTLLLQGDRDELVAAPLTARMAEALRAHGDVVVDIRLPWANHAFDLVPGGLDGQLSTWATDRFLAYVLRR